MSWLPPGVPANTAPAADAPKIGVGTHEVVLTKFEQANPSKKSPGDKGYYDIAFVATFRAKDGSEHQEWIKFTYEPSPANTPNGIRLEQLLNAIGAPIPGPNEALNPAGVLAFAEGAEIEITMKQNGAYLNLDFIRAAGS